MYISPLENEVLTCIRKNQLLKKSDRCLTAVSGGPDSTALIYLLYGLRRLTGADLAIAHVNYNLRGGDSLADELYTRALAKKLNIPFFCLSVNLKKIMETEKGSLEEIARNTRYTFFAETAAINGFNVLALAHNADDQTETILMRLIRGSVSGLKGMELKRPFSPENHSLIVIRPLLGVTRSKIEAYCLENNLQPRQDLSNLENDFTRNRVRNKIIPPILAENPDFPEIINQTGRVLNEEDNYIQSIAAGIFQNSILEKTDNQLILSAQKLGKPEPFLQRRIFKEALENLTGKHFGFSFKNLEAINGSLEKGESRKCIELGNNYFFVKDRDYLVISRGEPDFTIPRFQYDLALNEPLFIPESGLTLFAEATDEIIKAGDNIITFSPLPGINKLSIRNYSPEQCFIPFGKDHPVRLKTFLDKKKIPEMHRKKINLLYAGDVLIWIIRIARSNELLVKKGTDRKIAVMIKGS